MPIVYWKMLKTQQVGGLMSNVTIDTIFKRFYSSIFRERRREGEREGQKHRCERETLITDQSKTSLPYVP